MFEKQHTLKHPVALSGVGLHTGKQVTMTFHPAPVSHGYLLRRIDLPGSPVIRPIVENVTDTSRGTTVSENGASVSTVEHALSALAGLQIDNVMVDIDGPETPILDGSSFPFVEAFRRVGIEEQEADREFYIIEEPIHYQEHDRHVDLAALPLNDFRMTVMIDYNSPVLGSQHATLLNIDDFEHQIAPSRTFCFLHELEALLQYGLIKGGDLSNAIVVVDRDVQGDELKHLATLFNRTDVKVAKEGILDNLELRYKNEPARHKLLDLVGDLALIGHPIKGQILAARPGHKANVGFAKKIKSTLKQRKIAKRFQSDKGNGVIFDIKAIQQILPHRYPFLLVDKIIHFTEQEIEGVKNVTVNEPFFQGHFDGNPIMPGVLQLEAMGQVGGIMLLNMVEDPKKIWVYFLAINNARFKRPVVPGDTIHFKLRMESFKRNICKMFGQAFVDGQLVSEAELVASIVHKKD